MSFIAAKSAKSVRKTVVLTTLIYDMPFARSTAPRFSITRVVWAVTSSSTNAPETGSSGIWPEQKSIPPAEMACEYGPTAYGASIVAITLFISEPERNSPTFRVNSRVSYDRNILNQRHEYGFIFSQLWGIFILAVRYARSL